MKIQHKTSYLEAKEAMDKNNQKCKKHNTFVYVFAIIVNGLVGFNFFKILYFGIFSESKIIDFMIAGILTFLAIGWQTNAIFEFLLEKIDEKLYKRVEIMDLINSDCNFIKIANNNLYFTEKNDVYDIVKKLDLNTFSCSYSISLKEVILDLDKFKIIIPC